MYRRNHNVHVTGLCCTAGVDRKHGSKHGTFFLFIFFSFFFCVSRTPSLPPLPILFPVPSLSISKCIAEIDHNLHITGVDERGESDAVLACAPAPAAAAADAASAGDDRKHGTLFFPCFFLFSLSLCIVFFPCFFFLSPLSLYLNVSPRS